MREEIIVVQFGEEMTSDNVKLGINAMKIDPKAENEKLLLYLYETLDNGKEEVRLLHRKLTYSYWISVGLSIFMFMFGLILLSVPFISAYWGHGNEWQSAVSGGLGIVDLVALFLIGPLKRIDKLMGNIAQVTIAIQSFQHQVALRLIELDSGNRETIGKAAEHIDRAAKENIALIQKYFEEERALPTRIESE